MSYFEDLTSYVYWGSRSSPPEAANVGWLDREHNFPTQQPTEEFLDCLWNFCKHCVVKTRGFHRCELCSDEFSNFEQRKTEKLLLGTAEIRVISNDRVYASPTLIYHYVSQHHYKPPDDFIKAVIDGPSPTADLYLKTVKEWDMSLEGTPVWNTKSFVLGPKHPNTLVR